jgi:hypothetical protein
MYEKSSRSVESWEDSDVGVSVDGGVSRGSAVVIDLT